MTGSVIFDARHLDGRDLIFAGASGFMVLAGLVLVITRRKWNVGSFFPSLFLAISLFIAMVTGFGLWLEKQVGLPNKLRLGQCAIVEGTVTDLKPGSLRIGGLAFTAAPEVHLDQLREGQTVRIHHMEGEIARLEATGP